MELFRSVFEITSGTTVLDVGGYPFNWTLMTVNPCLTILNLDAPGPETRCDRWVVADGCRMPFADKSFDVVFCNSVIEHLGTFQRQAELAAEIVRVGRSYFVQTPDRHFPVEPHFLTLGVQFLPRRAKLVLLRYCSLWGLAQRRSPSECAALVDELCPLGPREMRALFPDAQIEKERLLGMTKSVIAVRRVS
jgi:SAM-dependent methyltransferase